MPQPIEIGALYRNLSTGSIVMVRRLEYFETGINVVFDGGNVEALEVFQRDYALLGYQAL